MPVDVAIRKPVRQRLREASEHPDIEMMLLHPVDENVDVVDLRLRDAARREGDQIEVDGDVLQQHFHDIAACDAHDGAGMGKVGDGSMRNGHGSEALTIVSPLDSRKRPGAVAAMVTSQCRTAEPRFGGFTPSTSSTAA